MFNGKSKFFLKKTNITEMTWCPYGGKKKETWDFPSGPVDTNLPASSGTWVWPLVWGDPTCRRAAKPVRHNEGARACLQPVPRNRRSRHSEKPTHCSWRVAPARRN